MIKSETNLQNDFGCCRLAWKIEIGSKSTAINVSQYIKTKLMMHKKWRPSNMLFANLLGNFFSKWSN